LIALRSFAFKGENQKKTFWEETVRLDKGNPHGVPSPDLISGYHAACGECCGWFPEITGVVVYELYEDISGPTNRNKV